MKAPNFTHLVLSACLTGTLAARAAAHALDLDKFNPMNIFKKAPESPAPSNEEKRSQEMAASSMMQEARAAGSSGRAQDIYKEIVRKYPYSDSAAEAQWAYAVLVRQNGKLTDAFEAFQKLIDKYRQSPRFSDAVQQQFELAEEAKSGHKQGTLLMIPMKIDTSEIVKMYQGVIKNAPYGKFAPLAQFAIGELYQDKGDKAQANLNYQMVVDNYPHTKQASEAQFRIGSNATAAAKRTQDSSNLKQAQESLQVYKLNNPAGERVGEAESMLNQNNQITAERSLKIAQFYERTRKPKAAAIYYTDALKYGSPDAVLKARERLASLASTHGEDLKQTPEQDEVETLVPAAVNLKGREDYVGPPAPEFAKVTKKSSKMRVEDDNFKPLPLKEPELPTKANSLAPSPGMLIPPVSAEKNNLPIPLPPDAKEQPKSPGPLPVPPKPEDAKPEKP